MKTSFISKYELIEWAKQVREACRKEGDQTAVSMIDEAISDYEADRFVLAVMGMAKRGKSTLINALLGNKNDDLAPIGKLPATSVSTSFTWGEQLSAEVINRDGTSIKISPNEIRNYVTEEGNPENKKGVQLLRVVGPFSNWSKNVTLVDLPGAGSIHEHHDQIIYQFLPQCDAVLLLTTARMPINEKELDLLREVKKSDIKKLFVAINKRDLTEPQELADCESHNRKQLGSVGANVSIIHQISAKQAFEGKLEESGLASLQNDMNEFLMKERGTLMAKRFVSRVAQAVRPVMENLYTRTTAASRSINEIKENRRQLELEKKNLERVQKAQEEKFVSDWNEAVDDVENSLPSIEDAVSEKIASKISSAGMMEVGKLEKAMPSFFNDVLDEELLPTFKKMEERFRELTEEFETRYPNVIVDKNGSARINSEMDTTLLKGAAAGGALAGGGLIFGTIAAGITTTAVVATESALGVAAAGALAGAGTLASGSIFGPILTGIAGLIPTTTTTTAVVPAAIAAFAGPVGWTLAGLGGAAVVASWAISKNKKKKKLQDTMDENIAKIFKRIREERIPGYRKLVNALIKEYRSHFQRRLDAIEDALVKAEEQSADPHTVELECQRYKTLECLMSEDQQKFLAI